MEDPWDSKPSKVQTFFQISITALAFLAFAGYLLCMIVQAIKTKGKFDRKFVISSLEEFLSIVHLQALCTCTQIR